ncbi:nucleotide exchange factor GrpE [Sphingobium sp.]|uniref:nucleotide exchange factor GrpE n=1 Tax=Sphingobium sp. TaxID=1912891 RepID=UPI0025ECD991|nr:nucleotide exchange factor GrpE [Sphingobium sp.]
MTQQDESGEGDLAQPQDDLQDSSRIEKDGAGVGQPASEAESPNELKDRLLRALADAENARKRADSAHQVGRTAGVAEVTQGLIPALDSLDFAMTTLKPASENLEPQLQAIREGLEATRRAFLNAFARFGIELISPNAGERFDPNIHEAVTTQPGEEAEAGKVAATLQSGYRVGTRLIRPARVVIVDGVSST